MITELFMNNTFNLTVILDCCVVLVLMSVWYHRGKRRCKGFIFRVTQFFVYVTITGTFGSIANNVIESCSLKFISPSVVNFICASLIALILTIKLFLVINQFEKMQINKGKNITSTRILSRIIKITIVVAIILLYDGRFGMNLSGLLTFGGIDGIAVGTTRKDILSNFFSGIILYFDRPFSIGDWTRSPDHNVGDTVAETGWQMTRINTFDHRPLCVPNSILSSISVENPGRMTNRRIKTVIGLRYEDADKVGAVVGSIRETLQSHPETDQKQTSLVYFNEFADSSLDIMAYCFTKTTV